MARKLYELAVASRYDSTMRVLINFQYPKEWTIHGMAQDCQTQIGPFMRVSNESTLLRLFRYVGGTWKMHSAAFGVGAEGLCGRMFQRTSSLFCG